VPSREELKARLADFLLLCFDAGEIRRLLSYLPNGEALTRRMSGVTASAAQIAEDAVQALDTGNYLGGHEFWARLKEQRPRRLDQIEAHQALFRQSAPASAAVQPTSDRRPTDHLRILLVSASPVEIDRTLNVDIEFARIVGELRNLNNVKLEQRTAVTFDRLRKAVQDVRPHVLHISSHGKSGDLFFHLDDSGAYQKVPPSALIRLLRALGKELRLVVLNACDSLPIAEAVVATEQPVAPWAIGMKHPIVDEDAIAYSTALYDGLASGLPVGDAHEAALSALELVVHKTSEPARPADIPRLVPNDPARASTYVLTTK
jgi:hypothetical protein